ncbi:MAG TPA: helix-turn-helix transcriptional regulator [Candidatus Eremiobacteraceae bacterium]|nr:helix-turn-helix transcriptional regulator [Candidatus Eremiobacteraceae bacterium]
MKQYRRKRREEAYRQEEIRQLIAGHERAGDIAEVSRLHKDAAQHYHDALHAERSPSSSNGIVSQSVLAAPDRARLCEKLATALFSTSTPEKAHPWLERALREYSSDSAHADKAIAVLKRMENHRWLECKTDTTPDIIAKAVDIAERAGNKQLVKLTKTLLAYCLHVVGRYEESDAMLSRIARVTNDDDGPVQLLYYDQRAIKAAFVGERDRAYSDFERAAHIGVHKVRGYSQTTVWDDYALAATALGEIDLAKLCHERALLVARRYHIHWRTSYLCLRYADVLARMGQFEPAREYVMDALSYDIHTPRVTTLLAAVAIPLAIHLQDDWLLKRCASPRALDLALRSGETILAARVATAFAQWYAKAGEAREARAVLKQALRLVRHVYWCWDLALEIARSGSPSDMPQARSLLDVRSKQSHPEVALACLHLFDAYVAQREQRLDASQRHAAEAVAAFRAIKWEAYAAAAHALLPGTTAYQTKRTENGVVDGMRPMLTIREQQVADLVLHGLTNRAIAERLNISENTVESHMSGIMSRLGVRSRHQLSATLSESSEEL